MVAPQQSAQGSVAPADHPPQSLLDADWQWVCDSARKHGSVPLSAHRQTVEALYGHLCGVNRWMNLTRIASDRAYLQQHLLDSLIATAAPWWPDCDQPLRCADLGSGGGYPGLPLAMVMPASSWLLVDSRQRKARFLHAAGSIVDPARVTGMAFRGREAASAAPTWAYHCDMVTTRATGTVLAMADEAKPLLRSGGRLVAWQGPSFAGEQEDQLRQQLITERSAWSALDVHPYRFAEEDPWRYLVSLSKR